MEDIPVLRIRVIDGVTRRPIPCRLHIKLSEPVFRRLVSGLLVVLGLVQLLK